jgi:CubicO group peptidase (beta-lactamase class C family)
LKTLLLSAAIILSSLSAGVASAGNARTETREPRQLVDPQIAQVERGLDLPRLMREHGIPGVSVAVIDHYRIAWAKGYGFTEKGGAHPVSPQTMFMAGSISKPVAAVGALALVQRGLLKPDADVNQSLKSWKVPDNPLTADRKVTLARILDHTSGITGGDFFPGYGVNDEVPTLTQVLAGSAPAATPPVRVTYVPGSRWEYSGSAYLVAQQLMVDASGKPFPALMKALVFDPLEMRDSSFQQPLPSERADRAAQGTLINGKPVEGGWHVQPEMAAGGLWTTPSDLAKLAVEIALASRGQSHKVLSENMAADMLAPHWDKGVINILGTSASPDRMGYGFFVGAGHRFGHIGGNVGYQATMVMFADTGKGAVIMTNSDIGLQAGNELLNRIAEVYRWSYRAPPPP